MSGEDEDEVKPMRQRRRLDEEEEDEPDEDDKGKKPMRQPRSAGGGGGVPIEVVSKYAKCFKVRLGGYLIVFYISATEMTRRRHGMNNSSKCRPHCGRPYGVEFMS